MKNIATLFALITVMSSYAQTITLNIEGLSPRDSSIFHLSFKNGKNETFEVIENGVHKFEPREDLKYQLESIDLFIDNNQFNVLMEDPSFKLGMTDKSNIESSIGDTFKILIDTYPFPRSSILVESERLYNLPDYKNIRIVRNLKTEGWLILRPEFNLETQSTFFASIMQDAVCSCMVTKHFTVESFENDLKDCMEVAWIQIVPDVDHSLKSYNKYIYSDELVMEMSHMIKLKVNKLINEKCIKKD